MTADELKLLGARKCVSLTGAGAYSGRSRNTLLRRIDEGLITAHKPDGAHWQVDRESIDNFFTPEVSQRAVDILRSLRK